MGNAHQRQKLLPYTIIAAAVNGDVDAIQAVVDHYRGYIACLATRRMYDDNGNPHVCIDDYVRRRLETQLIAKLLMFKVA